ncbi:MAG: DUF2339 domain-containing protein, partial [Candidatus Zixiibacteriota bacterium]
FAAMCAVTILALALALNKNDMILSLIGTIGGLGTPFFLYTGEGNIPGLVTYTCTLLFGTLAIYFLKGWRPLLAVSVIGGWMVMMSAISALSLGENATAPNQWAIQAGLLFAFLAFWLTPVSREVVGALKGGNYEASSAHPLAHFSAISAPIVALGLSIVLWEITNTMTRESWGIVAFTVSALYGLAGWRLYRWPQTYKLAYTHSLLAGFFFTLALALILEGDMLLISLATEAALLSFVSRKLSDLGVRIAGHILATIVLFWLAARVFLVYPEPELISSHALSDLWVILMGLVISQVYRSKLDSSVYLIGAAGALAAWLARGLEGNVEFLALIVEAIGLHLAARYRKNENIEISAHIFFVCLALLEFTRLFTFNSEGLPLVNWLAATDLFFIVTVIAVGFYLQAIEERRMYWLAGAAALAGLFIRELNSHWTLVAHALEATALSALARHYSDKALRGGSHALFGILAYYFVERLVTVTASGFPLFNGPGIADLTALAAALFVSLRYYSSQVRVVYQLGVHLGFLALVLREFIELENGHGYISAIWGVYAITLLVVGFRRANNTLRLTAMGTLLLVIGKLFLIDLANLETIWRILLFLSFGGILLGVSYYFQTLWKAPDTNSQAISKTEDTHQAN